MAEQAEAGDVGHRVHVLVLRQLSADAVEQGRGRDHLAIAAVRQRVLLDRRRIDADAERLGQDDRVAGLRVGVAAHVARMAQADHREAVDRLGTIDRMSARDRDAGVGAHRLPAARISRTISGAILSTGMPRIASAMIGLPPIA